jgi:hypothetical protein
MNHPIITFLGLAVLASNSLVTPAFGTIIYTTDSTGGFGKVDTTTGAYTQIETNILSGHEPHSLTSDGVGGFYTEGDNRLYAVDPFGVASMIGAVSLPRMYGMSRSSSGTIYGYDFDEDELGTVNTTTSRWTPIGSSNFSTGSPVGGRLAFNNGTLYGALDLNVSSDRGRFGSFNLDTGKFSVIASDAIYESMVLASDGATLYGLSGNSLYTLNPLNGTLGTPLDIIGAGDSPMWTGAASELTAVPEPTTLLSTLALISSGLLLRRRTKHPR